MIDAVVAQGDVAWVPVDREVVVWHPAAGASFVLDPTAALLWQCLDGESALGDVLADIADVVGAPLADVTADCLPVVESWLTAGIAMAGPPLPAPESPTLRTWRRLVAPPNG